MSTNYFGAPQGFESGLQAPMEDQYRNQARSMFGGNPWQQARKNPFAKKRMPWQNPQQWQAQMYSQAKTPAASNDYYSQMKSLYPNFEGPLPSPAPTGPAPAIPAWDYGVYENMPYTDFVAQSNANQAIIDAQPQPAPIAPTGPTGVPAGPLNVGANFGQGWEANGMLGKKGEQQLKGLGYTGNMKNDLLSGAKAAGINTAAGLMQYIQQNPAKSTTPIANPNINQFGNGGRMISKR